MVTFSKVSRRFLDVCVTRTLPDRTTDGAVMIHFEAFDQSFVAHTGTSFDRNHSLIRPPPSGFFGTLRPLQQSSSETAMEFFASWHAKNVTNSQIGASRINREVFFRSFAKSPKPKGYEIERQFIAE
jgi:hypothetical protein